MEGNHALADAAAIILTGGKSSRMGRPKALLLFDGEPLIVQIVRMLEPLFSEIVVVASPGQDLPSFRRGSGQAPPVKLVQDDVAHRGPVGGIYYGLRATNKTFAFVTSCDVPFLSPPLISYLTAQISDFDVVVPFWQGRFQPLFAVYRREVVPLLEAQIERGELRPIFLYDKVRTYKVSEEEIRRLDAEGLSFLNMNTPEDYQIALRRWRELHPIVEAPGDGLILCTVELFGIARLRAKTSKISLALPQEATLSQLFSALAERVPSLVGAVIAPDKNSLASGSACNINGKNFVRDPGVKVNAGDSIFIIPADAGG